MWKQRNKDQHEPGNKTNLSATIKVDRVVRGLYSMMHQVCVDDQYEFFNLDLDEGLKQSVPSNERWVKRFQTAIFSSAQRAKRDATSASKLIYKCWDHSKPKTTYKRENLQRQKRQTDAAEARLRQQTVTSSSTISITGTQRSTSRTSAEINS